MDLQHLSNEELNSKLKLLVQQEREHLNVILYHIAEVERRKLYLKMDYPNLYIYLEKEMGYAGGSAQRYKDAALLLRDVPDLAEKLESKQISLAQVSIVQKSIRAKREKVSREEKQNLIENLCGQTVVESQVTVARALDVEIKAAPKTIHQKDESVRLEITFTKEQWEKFQKMRELLSPALPCGNWDQVIEYVADKVIQQKTSTKVPTATTITPAVRKFILQRDKCCQVCKSRWNLQVDHIIPVWAGGTNELSNLRALCANHNRQRYKEQARIR